MIKAFAIAIALALTSFDAHAVLVCANDTYSEHANWYVGQPASVLDQIDLDGDIWCQASGAELTYVQQHFTGLRGRTGKAVASITWIGEDAGFLMSNL